MRYLLFVGGMTVGFVCLRYTKWLVDNLNVHIKLAESLLGPGSMHTVWKLAGLALIIFSIYILFGGFGL